jgi:muramidase (phage lysozyme)
VLGVSILRLLQRLSYRTLDLTSDDVVSKIILSDFGPDSSDDVVSKIILSDFGPDSSDDVVSKIILSDFGPDSDFGLWT